MEQLFKVLLSLVDRAPWHSEDQHRAAVEDLRGAEQTMTAGMADYVSPLPEKAPEPEPSTTGAPYAGPGATPIDYGQLAQAIVAAQQQQDQAAAAVAAAPDFGTPAPEGAPVTETHAAAQ